ncbi:MAG: antitoxin Xre/MbcA/ParS toxin-binding domain-containing protein [Rhodanobacteraceae bacterium]
MPTPALFQNLPKGDPLRFGSGQQFQPARVRDFLKLERSEVSRLANVSVNSVRYDDGIPDAVRERFEEIAATCNLVAEVFDGDAAKTALWFRTKNPMLGDASPRDMIRLRRFDRLRRFIVGAMIDGREAVHGNAETVSS